MAFSSLRQLLTRLGFEERIKGGHYIFTRGHVSEIIDLQPRGEKARPYQVKRLRYILAKYRHPGTQGPLDVCIMGAAAQPTLAVNERFI